MRALSQQRKRYAEEIRSEAKITNESIVEAFATVPREKFIGPGPWKIKPATLESGYQNTPDEDPIHLYQNVLVALDADRGLNNGLPSWLAQAIQHCNVKVADEVTHIGCGVGYYTAIFAELVGPSGAVRALEVDENLGAQAIRNLSGYKNVIVKVADGSTQAILQSDVIFVNAGATHLQPSWIENLRTGGRLIVPLTYSRDSEGRLLKITRNANAYAAEFVQAGYIYPCIGSRDDQHAHDLKQAVDQHSWNFRGSFRLDPENADDSCWLKTEWYWLSKN